jgi:predicted phosphodiesterase
MKLLLISDTHGNIDIINDIAAKESVDACIHAGDFGFYDENSVENLNTKELRLQIKHSSVIPWEERKEYLTVAHEEQRRIIKKYKMLGNFSDYILGEKKFSIPVYAVWGNHEDQSVILKLLKNPIKNLTLIHESNQVLLEDFCLFGVGGNFVINQTLLQPYKGLPGTVCRLNSALPQYEHLIKRMDLIDSKYQRILLTHVSPEYEPLAELLAWRTGAGFTISGHMGFPEGSEWHTLQGDEHRMLNALIGVKEKFAAFAEKFDVFIPQHHLHSIQHLNLPDAHKGYGILELNNKKYQYSIKKYEISV